MGVSIRPSFRLLIENSRDDERYLTSDILPILHKTNCLIPSFVVSHHSFQGQRNGHLEGVLRSMLVRYYELMSQQMTLHPSLDHREEVRVVRGVRVKKTHPNLTSYCEVYNPLSLIDDPEDGERELWTHELRSKMLRSFGFEETALALFESDLGDGDMGDRGTNAGRRGEVDFSEL
jgi:hypothetical protein